MGRPYFKLYGRDFRDGVRPLSLEETGAYTLLLTLIYDANGPIPDDCETIRRHLGCDRRVWARIRERLIATGKITALDGLLSNDRADRELADAARLSDLRSDAGRVGGAVSGQVRRKSATSPQQVRDKSATSPPDLSVLANKKSLSGNNYGEAFASKAEPYPEERSSTAPNGAAEQGTALLCDLDREHPSNPPTIRNTEVSLPSLPGPPEIDLASTAPVLARNRQALAACVEAAGPGLADPAKHAGLHLSAPRIAAAMAAGCDLEADILPVIRARTAYARASPITSWAYFEAAWLDARNERLRPMPQEPGARDLSGTMKVTTKGARYEFAKPRTHAQEQAERGRNALQRIREVYGITESKLEFINAAVID